MDSRDSQAFSTIDTNTGGMSEQESNTTTMQDPMADGTAGEKSKGPQDYETPTRGRSGREVEPLQMHNTTVDDFQFQQTPSIPQVPTPRGMSGQGVQTPAVHNTPTGGRNARDHQAQANFKTPIRGRVGQEDPTQSNILRGHGIRQTGQASQASLQPSAPNTSDTRRPSCPTAFNAQSYRANQALPPATSGPMAISAAQYRNAHATQFTYPEMNMATEQDSMMAQNTQNMHRGMPLQPNSMMMNTLQNMHRGVPQEQDFMIANTMLKMQHGLPRQTMMRSNMNSNVFRGQGEMGDGETDVDPCAVSPSNTHSTVDFSDGNFPYTPVSNRKFHGYNNAHGDAFLHQQEQPESPTPMKMTGSAAHSPNANPLMMFSGNNNMHHGNMHSGVQMGQQFRQWDPNFSAPNGGAYNMGHLPSNMALNLPQNMGANAGMVHLQGRGNAQVQGANFSMHGMQQRLAVAKYYDAQHRASAHQQDSSQQPEHEQHQDLVQQRPVGPGTRHADFQQPASSYHAALQPRGHPEPVAESPEPETQASPLAKGPQNPNAATAPSIPLTKEERQRAREQQILARGKEQGMTYKQIQQQIGTHIAESTLRGRWRMMSKEKRDRVRKPKWTNLDIRLLLDNVTYQMANVRNSRDGRAHTWATRLARVSWKRVGEYILQNGGSYSFGTATCKKKFLQLQK